jgi:hypothetical protein
MGRAQHLPCRADSGIVAADAVRRNWRNLASRRQRTGGSSQTRSLWEILSRFGMAMVFVFYAYGGWNDAAFVAAEVRNRQRNLPWALFIGTGGIMLIYLLVNAAYLYGLGFAGVSSSWTPAADVLELASKIGVREDHVPAGHAVRVGRDQRSDLHRSADLRGARHRPSTVRAVGTLARSAEYTGLVAGGPVRRRVGCWCCWSELRRGRARWMRH